MALGPEEVIRRKVLDSGAVRALVADRVYPQLAPQGAAVPYITFFRVTGSPVRHMRGPATIAEATIQIDVFAPTYSQMLTIAEGTRLALDGFRGPISVAGATLHISHLSLDNERVQLVGPLSASEDPIHHFIQDFRIAFQQPTTPN